LWEIFTRIGFARLPRFAVLRATADPTSRRRGHVTAQAARRQPGPGGRRETATGRSGKKTGDATTQVIVAGREDRGRGWIRPPRAQLA
jgi:hypothetical protein